MEISYVIYNDLGEIIRSGSTSSENLDDKILNAGEYVLEGVGRAETHKVVDGQIVEKTQEEQDDFRYDMVKDFYPTLDFTGDIDQQIDDFYVGHVDVQQWKIDNYRWLRRQIYPEIGDQLDALLKYLKLKSDLEPEITDIISEWESVKDQFPKS